MEQQQEEILMRRSFQKKTVAPVSYTHLTLPTNSPV